MPAMILKKALESRGHTVHWGANGALALALVREHRPAILISDVEMPEMDGLTATRRIRADRAGKHGPYIVAMTANAMQGDREECLAAGMDDYVTKPIRTELLVEALARGAATIAGLVPAAATATDAPLRRPRA